MLKCSNGVLCLFFTLIFASCNQLETTKIQEVSPITLYDLQNFSEPVQNIIFTKLTPEEKYNLWKEKINQVAAQSLSHEQRSLVLEVSKILSVDIFIAGHTKNQEVINKLAEDFTNRALEHFPNGQLRRYFGNLESLKPSPFEDFSNNKMIHPRVQDMLDKSKDELAKRRIECNCRWGWWCDSKCTDNGNCSGNGGKYAGGCGFILLQDCDSVCKS